ncbi:MAG: GyrI-like domain-containing protein [Burkholderiales bacterium]
MRTHHSRSEYQSRMHRVIEHIDRHLEDALDLDTLASVANFSPFHFHRLFAAWMGETLGDYLRRRRVEIAAMRLAAQPRLSVLNSALSVGFGSAEAFSRAFRVRFGCSPSAWRLEQATQRGAKSNPGQMNSNLGHALIHRPADHEASPTSHKASIMKVQVIDRQPATVAYLRHLGPYGKPIEQFWMNTYYAWAATNNLLDRPRYGISHDDPGITAAEQCRYDACAEVPPEFVASGGALKTTLPGGKYAMLDFKGTGERIGEAWSALLRDWLPSSGLQLDARPCFEYYPKDANDDPRTGAFECKICIPVMPL